MTASDWSVRQQQRDLWDLQEACTLSGEVVLLYVMCVCVRMRCVRMLFNLEITADNIRCVYRRE